jgi:hypothetical protein
VPTRLVQKPTGVSQLLASGIVASVEALWAGKWKKEGVKRWQFTTQASVHSSPTLSPDGESIFVGSFDKRLYAINAGSGALRWSFLGVVECAPASLSPASSSLTHAHRMDGFCNQNADQLGSLAGPSLLTVYVGVVECAPASLSPASSSLTHARRMDGLQQPTCHILWFLNLTVHRTARRRRGKRRRRRRRSSSSISRRLPSMTRHGKDPGDRRRSVS